ncbi:MAG: NADAR family protein [Alphaproteobacteria bacterium]
MTSNNRHLYTATIHNREDEAPWRSIQSFRGPFQFLSNFEAVDIVVPSEQIPLSNGSFVTMPDMVFPSVENAYMAWKTTSLETRLWMQKATPKDAKKRSQQPDFIALQRADYSDFTRLKAMFQFVSQKFDPTTHTLLATQLMEETGRDCVIEGNAWCDRFWGLCLRQGYGQNHLGRIHMTVRDNVYEHFGLPRAFQESLLPSSIFQR